MCTVENDQDMKIVGEVMPKKSREADTAESWVRHKNSGNIDRAHRLGKMLAQQLLNIQDDDPAKLLQKQMLFAFTVDAGAPVFLNDDLLVQTARGTFFERLRTLLPSFEVTLHRLGAFTFYRLCLDNESENALPAEKLGTVFAALCGRAEDPETEQEGTALFRSYLARLEETVGMVEFERI